MDSAMQAVAMLISFALVMPALAAESDSYPNPDAPVAHESHGALIAIVVVFVLVVVAAAATIAFVKIRQRRRRIANPTGTQPQIVQLERRDSDSSSIPPMKQLEPAVLPPV
ncbi:hypothetical protein GLOTRDRAFT_126265 [Gloeophyllum trabeum ATCC 11539]|uniref:Transmembrane protein n=1 Tax=Gloeophyllum trabeum (strain ATCC 11539 / FP-39264 / Madison 617) TaxID=670483 RepID=S7RWP5_GLOTA|nr:uncharacterized protein GLOTRDRAFT_126265 [Gloeophyllum trabeum ATCC 11539]EPQ57774.1 hypothetical protein GLOTRDRAFT_126265 [Gloeophyllum trabeum ATCC 11539]